MNIPADIKSWKVYVAYGRAIRMMEPDIKKGLQPDIRANVRFCETIQEAYSEAIRVEHMLKQSTFNKLNH